MQTGASIGQVDSIIYPILCKYEDIDAIYLPNQAAEGVSLLSRQIGEKFVEQDKKLIDLDNNRLQIVSNKDNVLKINNAEEDKNILKDILSEPYYNGIIAFWGQFNNQKNEVTNYE